MESDSDSDSDPAVDLEGVRLQSMAEFFHLLSL